MDQVAMWEEGQKPPKCCVKCSFCAALAEPYEREDGSHIYGYCFMSGSKNSSPNMGKGFPIFLPLDCGASCESFKRKAKEDV